jgi:hypothetical protein
MRIRLRLTAVLAVLVAGCFAAPAHALETGVVETMQQTKPTASTAKDLGAGWVRIWASWETAQPASGTWAPHIIAGLNASVHAAKSHGLKVLVVVHRSPAWASGGKGGINPPTDPDTFAQAMRGFASKVPGADAWELWNEEDAHAFWEGGADPAKYAAMVKAAYPAIKSVQPNDVVVTGATTGNNMDFIADLYKHGVKGSFDAVAVHTDTGCLVDGPGRFYRDELGRIGRYTFSGYREVHAVMARNGDADKRIWMTELGWNSQSTGPKSCNTGKWAGQKPLGVSEEQQAAFLTEAYRCLAADPIVEVAFWFGVQDIPSSENAGGYGLFRAGGGAKPAAAAFAALAGGIPPQPCGGAVDIAGPEIVIAKPTDGAKFVGMFPVHAKAVEPAGGSGVKRIEIHADGKLVRSFGDGRAKMRAFWPSREWRNGSTHTVTFKASDEALNVTSRTIRVTKVRKLPRVRTGATLAVAQLAPTVVQVTGGVAPAKAHAAVKVPGKAFVTFQRQALSGKWKTVHRIKRRASRPVDVTQALESGHWRVSLRYPGRKRFKKSRSQPVVFDVP